MVKRFENGIDLSELLWSAARHDEAVELINGAGDPMLQACLLQIIREHNSAIEQLSERLSAVTQFQFSENLSIVWRGDNLWCVVDRSGLVLNADGEWEYEPNPSSRTDGFRARTRFSLEQAFERAKADALSGQQ